MIFIYKITNKINSKVYIGQTRRTIESRWKQHQYPTSKCHRLRLAIIKYGRENFTVEQIESCLDSSSAIERERYWISFFDSMTNGYNIKLGHEMSDDMIAKISKSNTGKKLSPEHIAKLSLAKKGKPSPTKGIKTGKPAWNSGTRKPKPAGPGIKTVGIIQYSQDGEYIREFEQISSAADWIIENTANVTQGSPVCVASNLRQSALRLNGVVYGFRWKFKKDEMVDFTPDYKPIPPGTPLISVVALGDGFGIFYDSVIAAAANLGVHSANIVRSCKTGGRCGGLLFKYT